MITKIFKDIISLMFEDNLFYKVGILILIYEIFDPILEMVGNKDV